MSNGLLPKKKLPSSGACDLFTNMCKSNSKCNVEMLTNYAIFFSMQCNQIFSMQSNYAHFLYICIEVDSILGLDTEDLTENALY